MSRRHKLELHQKRLAEVRGIMHAMKTLAYLETHKLTRFLEAQDAAVAAIETAANDFLAHYPLQSTSLPAGHKVFLIIGAERGFCGDFNQQLLRQLVRYSEERTEHPTHLVVVGHKLQLLLEGDARVAARIDGAGIAEEVGKVLSKLAEVLSRLQADAGLLELHALYHSDDKTILLEQLLPPFQHPPQPNAHHRMPPLLQLPPTDFLLALTDHYLLAVLHRLLYTSLMAENRRRLSHLEGALQHLDDKSAALHRRRNILRQEEIIEEIEVKLLNTSGGPLDEISSD